MLQRISPYLRPARPAGWGQDAMMVAVFALVTAVAAAGWTDGLDVAVRDASDAHRPQWARITAIVFNHVGQGWLLTWVIGGTLTVLLWWRIRSWRAVLPWPAAQALTYLTVGPLKVWTDRAAPRSECAPDPVRLFNPDIPAGCYDRSYPSGHVVNAMVWWAVIMVLAGALWQVSDRARRVARYAPPVILLFTTTYLAYHWLTDGLAALALGVVLVRLVDRVNWSAVLTPAGEAVPSR